MGKRKEKQVENRKVVSAKKWIVGHDKQKPEPDKNSLIFDLDKTVNDDGLCHWDVWTSQCGLYRVFRSEDKHIKDNVFFAASIKKLCSRIAWDNNNKRIPDEIYEMWDSIETEKGMRGHGYYPKRWTSLAGAAEACLAHSKRMESNIDSLVAHADALGLAGKSVGKKWGMGAEFNDEIVRVREKKDRGEKQTEKRTTANTATASVPKQPRVPKERGSKVGLDRFGSRIDTDRARFNAAFTDAFQSLSDLIKKSGMPKGRALRRATALTEEGFLECKGDKYRCTGKTI